MRVTKAQKLCGKHAQLPKCFPPSERAGKILLNEVFGEDIHPAP